MAERVRHGDVLDAGDTGDNLGWLDQTTLRGLDMIARTGLDAWGRPLDQLYSLVPRAGATSFTIVLSQVVGGVATGIGAATFAVGATPEQIRAALQLLLFGQTAGADAGVSMTRRGRGHRTRARLRGRPRRYPFGFRGEVNADPANAIRIVSARRHRRGRH
jgi:hypothetical protein